MEVEQDQIGLELVVQGGGLGGIGGAPHLHVPGLLEDALQEDDVDSLVVHHEDPCIGWAWSLHHGFIPPSLAGFGRSRTHLEQIATIADHAPVTPNALGNRGEP